MNSGNIAKDPRKQLRGYQNRSAGNTFEDLIMKSCQHYDIKNIAYIEKTPEPMKIVRNMGEGKFLTVFQRQAQPDFKGTLAGGRAICFDAKHTDSDRIELSRLTDEQIKCLNRQHDMSAITLVVISIKMQDFYSVPWEIFRAAKLLYGHKYMSIDELEQFKIKIGCGFIDFLETYKTATHREEMGGKENATGTV